MSSRVGANPANAREARRTVAASLRWIADLLLDGADDVTSLDRLVVASAQLAEAERVIEKWKRIIEERDPRARHDA